MGPKSDEKPDKTKNSNKFANPAETMEETDIKDGAIRKFIEIRNELKAVICYLNILSVENVHPVELAKIRETTWKGENGHNG